MRSVPPKAQWNGRGNRRGGPGKESRVLHGTDTDAVYAGVRKTDSREKRTGKVSMYDLKTTPRSEGGPTLPKPRHAGWVTPFADTNGVLTLWALPPSCAPYEPRAHFMLRVPRPGLDAIRFGGGVMAPPSVTSLHSRRGHPAACQSWLGPEALCGWQSASARTNLCHHHNGRTASPPNSFLNFKKNLTCNK